MARVLDNPRAVSSQPAAAKVLAVLLDKLRSACAWWSRRSGVGANDDYGGRRLMADFPAADL
jgi:hypothetical protein